MTEIRPLGTIHEQDYYCNRVDITLESAQQRFARWNCYEPARYSRFIETPDGTILVRVCEAHNNDTDPDAYPDPEPHMGDQEWDDALTPILERDWAGNWWTP